MCSLGLVWFIFFGHSISVTHHSSLITLKYHVCLAPSLTSHHSIFFTLFVGPIPITRCRFSFFSSVPKLIEPSGKKKKKTLEHEDRISERRTNPKQTKPVKEEEKKKKKKREETQNKSNQWKKKKKKKKKRTE